MSFANVLSPFEFQTQYPHQLPYLHSTTATTMNNPNVLLPTTSSGFSFGSSQQQIAQYQQPQPQFFQQFQPQQPQHTLQPQAFTQPFTQPHPTKRPRGSYEEELSEEAWAPKRTRVVFEDNHSTFNAPPSQLSQFGSAPNYPTIASMEIPSSGALILHPSVQKRAKRSSTDERGQGERERYEAAKRNRMKGFFDTESLDDPSFPMRNIITVDNRLSAWKEDLSKAIILYPTPPAPSLGPNDSYDDYEKPFMQSRSYITEVDDEEETPSGMDVA